MSPPPSGGEHEKEFFHSRASLLRRSGRSTISCPRAKVFKHNRPGNVRAPIGTTNGSAASPLARR
jgi:hypothetical protein